MSTLASFLGQVNDTSALAGSMSSDAGQGADHDVDLLTIAAITVAGMLAASAMKSLIRAIVAAAVTAFLGGLLLVVAVVAMVVAPKIS
jgi:hypothetical protein